MDTPVKLSLFFLKQNPYFEDGTLFELQDSDILFLPDRGDGTSAKISRSKAISCPPFAENVPPGQCPVRITSFQLPVDTDSDISRVTVEQTIHYQIIVVPLPVSEIATVSVNDRLRDFEADRYEPSSDDPDETYRLHIGHLRPGFYDVEISTTDGKKARMTFIKLFPPPFTDRYADILAETDQRNPKTDTEKPETKRRFSPPARFHGKHSDELLNTALKISTEWGENFQKPIKDRILAIYPDLTATEIDELTTLAREAEYYIYSLAESELAGDIAERDIPVKAIEQFPWLDNYNVSRLTGIGMYYARR